MQSKCAGYQVIKEGNPRQRNQSRATRCEEVHNSAQKNETADDEIGGAGPDKKLGPDADEVKLGFPKMTRFR